MNASRPTYSPAIQPLIHKKKRRAKLPTEIRAENVRAAFITGVRIMRNKIQHIGKGAVLKFSLLAAASFGLSGCVYDVGLGYASDGYYNDAYDCDPYWGYDNYYQCDYGHGFYNIGFGGGWYDSYWYPGYGFYLFDNVGRRYPMRDHHRRYWGEKRHNWYRENRGRHHDGGRYRGRGQGYTGNATPGTIGWPEQNGGRAREDDDRRGRREGRNGRNRQWTGGDGTGVNAIPTPNPDIVQRPGRGRERGDGFRNGFPRGERTGRAYGDNPSRALPQPQPQAAPPAPRAAPSPQRDQPQRPPAPRPNRTQGENVREE